ncbi:hypothetical protein [Polyangium jinanense]|uniref:Uncharacterized protein n=1 Tax=Polyangium jinanense TaxID=2829994 RepID=A0A9X3XGD9_9BACT|nr:hypothetical protein [Polyangium jinanense]MDC3988618.1 hypothetical protein [Polyangium jinanense]
MLRRVFAWCLPLLLLVLCVPSLARAEIRVCVRLPGHPKMDQWALSGSATVMTQSWQVFTAKTNGLTTFAYDPWAPPENVRFLPPPYNKLQCPKPPPRPEPAPAKSAPKDPAEENKAGAAPAAEASEPPKPPPAKEEQAEVVPPGVKKMPERPPEKPRPSPPPPQGVLSNEPLLPSESTLPKRDEVHPPKCVDEHCTLVDRGGALPERVFRPGAPLSSVASCEQTKEGCKGDGKPKTRLEEIAQELAIAAAIANGELNADLSRKGGKRFGIIGGTNEDGVDNPIVQAAVATAAIASGVLLGQADKFAKKLEEACAKKAPLIIQGTEELSKETAEFLAKQYGADIAHALEQNGAIGAYEVMSKFTKDLGGAYQAHHLLEKAMAGRWGLTKELDKIPSVILTEAKHKEITNRLKALTPRARDLKELWRNYQDAYANYPHWLEAIKPYFFK